MPHKQLATYGLAKSSTRPPLTSCRNRTEKTLQHNSVNPFLEEEANRTKFQHIGKTLLLTTVTRSREIIKKQ